MRADGVASRGRGLIGIVLAGAAALMLGALIMLAGLIMTLADKRSFLRIIESGAVLAAGGVAFGVVVLAGYALGRGRRGGRRRIFPNARVFHLRKGAYPARHADAAARFQQAPGHQAPFPAYGPPPGHATPPGYGPSAAHAGPAGPDHRDRQHHHHGWRPGGQEPMQPTSVYSPGGLIGPPRGAHGPAPADPPAPGREFGYARPAYGHDPLPGAEYARVIHVERPRRGPSRGPAARPQAAPPPVPPRPGLTDVLVDGDEDGASPRRHDPAATGRARGPFEPLRREEPVAAASEGAADQAAADPAPGAHEPVPPGQPLADNARYAAAEPVGDHNAGQHLNDLLRRQRELISGYLKGAGVGKPVSFGADPGVAGDVGGGGDAGGAGAVSDAEGQEMVVTEQPATD